MTHNHTLLTVLISNTFLKFLRLGNLAWNFFCLVHGFLWFFWEPQGYFLGFDFCSYSIILFTWNSEYPLNIFFDGCLLLGLWKDFEPKTYYFLWITTITAATCTGFDWKRNLSYPLLKLKSVSLLPYVLQLVLLVLRACYPLFPLLLSAEFYHIFGANEI